MSKLIYHHDMWHTIRNVGSALRGFLYAGLLFGASSFNSLEFLSTSGSQVGKHQRETSLQVLTDISADTGTISIKPGWNLVSLPLNPSETYLYDVFPDAKSHAYRYESGYVRDDTLRCGLGYWVKFDSANIYTISGDTCPENCVEVSKGWNLIGSFPDTLDDSLLFIEPFGHFTSSFFSYDADSGYEIRGKLIPGKGHWVKADSPGTMIFDSNGTKWVKISDLIAEVFAIDTTRPDIIYAGTGNMFGGLGGRLYRSTNRGESWDTLLINLDAWRITFDPINHGTIYVTIGLGDCGFPNMPPGIIKSSDDGESWFRADSGIDIDCDIGPVFLVVDWSDSDVLYAVTGGVLAGHVYRSSNGGQSWYIPLNDDTLDCPTDPRCGLGTTPMLRQSRIDPDVVYAMAAPWGINEFLLRGSNAGTDWIYKDSVPNGPSVDFVVDPSTDGRLYCAGWGFSVSTDDGLSWQVSETGLPDSLFYIDITPLKNSPTIFLGGGIDSVVGIFRSDDSGATWSAMDYSPPDLESIYFDERNMIVYSKCQNNLYRKRLR